MINAFTYLVCYVKYSNILVANLMVIEFIPVIVEQFYFLKSKNKIGKSCRYVRIATYVAESRCIGERKDIFFLNFVIQ